MIQRVASLENAFTQQRPSATAAKSKPNPEPPAADEAVGTVFGAFSEEERKIVLEAKTPKDVPVALRNKMYVKAGRLRSTSKTVT